jgi:SAM-dependent methyltransferase
MQANGSKKRRNASSSLRYQLIRLVICCVGSIICLFLIFRYMGRRIASNGSAVGIASMSAANDLLALGTASSSKKLDNARVKQTLHSISNVLDRIVKENAKERNRKYNVIQLPSKLNEGQKYGKKIVDVASSTTGTAASVKKTTRKGIRARMGDDGQDDQQGSIQQAFVPTPKATAGSAEIGMMKQSARSLIPQLLDLTAALSALPGDVYVENSGTQGSTLLLQARLLVARAVEHIEKIAEIANNKQLQNIPKQLLKDSQNGNLKVQLGAAGDSALLGWLNIDIVGNRAIRTKPGPRPAELSMSIASNPLPMDQSACSFVFAAHTLEHIRYPDDTNYVFNEVYRVLKPGGVLRLIVPNARLWLEQYVAAKRDVSPADDPSPFWKAARKNWASWQWVSDDPVTGTRLPVTLRYLGAMETSLEMINPHKTGFDFETLKGALMRSGFQAEDIIESTFMGSKYKELQIDHTSEAAEHYYVENGKKKYFSLFIEAKKRV